MGEFAKVHAHSCCPLSHYAFSPTSSLYIYNQDVKSSNHTFINSEWLSLVSTESDPFKLKTGDSEGVQVLKRGIVLQCD